MTPIRRVRRIRLRGPDDGAIRRGVILLEDALRTASAPGLSTSRHRVLCIRRMDVGPIRTEAGPTALSLAIERALGRIGAVVDGDDPAADRAEAVGFADRIEPVVSLALRLASGRPVDAWFWPLAVPGFSATATPRDSLRVLILGTSSGELGDVTLPILLERARRAGRIDAVLEALRPGDGPALLAGVGWSAETWEGLLEGRSVIPGALPIPLPAIPPEWLPVVTRWATAWGPDAPLSAWLARAALVVDRPARRLDPALPAIVRSSLRSIAAGWIRRGEGPSAGSAGHTTGSPTPLDDAPGSKTPPIPPPAPNAPDFRRPGLPPEDEAVTSSASHGAIEGPRTESAAPPFIPRSDDAGFFFLVCLLERLGIARWLAENPAMIEWDFPARFLAYAADRLRLAPEDPARMAIGVIAPATEPGGWTVPFDGRLARCFPPEGPGRGDPASALRNLTAGPPGMRRAPGDRTAGSLRGWFLHARRACLRWTGIPLRSVVRREGGVSVTRTHIDVAFDFRQADARIRREGLDLDPGWVPWLGRVVLFHYE